MFFARNWAFNHPESKIVPLDQNRESQNRIEECGNKSIANQQQEKLIDTTTITRGYHE
jgi:hypothetical protein